MVLRLTGTNIEITQAARAYVERKIGKLNRHFPNILEMKVEVSEEKTKNPAKRYLGHLTVDADGTVFHAEERADDQFQVIDKLADNMTRQLEDYKGKRSDTSRATLAKEAAVEAVVPSEPPETGPQVVKIKNFVIKPMTLDEAIDQMLLLGHDFYIFHDSDGEKMKVVYKRKDGNYGLIDPRLG
ncbi:MAG: ribosome-associated translation inhibitor RaiA [Chloroflexi bacterium]|nr:ribosome-associated translation inhibitor RaiA [Chloroflexota bacterium]